MYVLWHVRTCVRILAFDVLRIYSSPRSRYGTYCTQILAAEMARRRAAISRATENGFGSEGLARFDAHHCAMIGLLDCGSVALRADYPPATSSAAGVFLAMWRSEACDGDSKAKLALLLRSSSSDV